MSKKIQLTRRRAATFMAALGMLVMSSGIALMVAASPANAAAIKVNICHATSSDTNPYVFIQVDDDSAKFKGHLMHRNDPNKQWKSAGTFNGVQHAAGDPKPDLIGSFTDGNGVFHAYDGTVTADTCNGPVVENPPAVADVTFIDPSCDNNNVADFDATASHATYEVTSGSAAPGASIEITFTADEGYAFEEGAQTVFTHTFGAAQEGCDVSPPIVAVTSDPTFTDPTCDTAGSVVLPDAPPPVSRLATGPVITTKDVNGVHYVVTGDLSAGGTVDVDATALDGYVLAEGATTHWSHTFTTPTDCGTVNPPTVNPPTVNPPQTSPQTVVKTPSLVHAGLVSLPGTDPRGEQGLALLVGGLIIMTAAGGLGLRSGAKSGI